MKLEQHELEKHVTNQDILCIKKKVKKCLKAHKENKKIVTLKKLRNLSSKVVSRSPSIDDRSFEIGGEEMKQTAET